MRSARAARATRATGAARADGAARATGVRLASPVLAAVLAVVLPACGLADRVAGAGADDPQAAGEDAQAGGGDRAGSAGEAPSAELEPFYAQQVEWGGCEGLDLPFGVTADDHECATLEVPLDYDDPAGATIDLALTRLPASGDRLGSLVVNPGGPGGSGVDYALSADFAVSAAVRERYDVVGFDPRGVFRSSAVDCLTDPELDAFYATDPSPDDEAELAALEEVSTQLAAGCGADPTAPHVDSVSVARDLDVLRAALGDSELTYLGKSYGTVIGALYAELFPERAGRLVLDGAVDLGDYDPLDPTLSIEQLEGFETALESFVDDCLGREDCPLSGTVADGVDQVRALVASLDAAPLPTGDEERPLGQGLAAFGLAGPLYQYDAWPLLRDALAAALTGDGEPLLFLNDVIFNERDDSGSYRGNSGEAIYAVNCLDGGSDPEALAAVTAEDVIALGDEVLAASPTFGPLFGYGGLPCVSWPHERAAWPSPLDAQGASPILVIGTTRDPATPQVWAERLAAQLESGVLATYDGDGHTAYRATGAGCIDDLVDAFLLDGEVPEDGVTCVAEY